MSDGISVQMRYWIELRKRLLYCIGLFFFIFSVLLYFSNTIYLFLTQPLLNQLPKNQGLIAIHVLSPFFVPMALCVFMSMLLTIPFFLYQIWSFIAPGLYVHEKRMIWPLLLFSIILFYSGILFAYGVIFPVLFGFLKATTPSSVLLSPDISLFLDFCLKLLMMFGVLFEIPVVTIVLILTGIQTREQLKYYRPYVIVGA